MATGVSEFGHEDWKGPENATQFDFGLMSGLGTYNTSTGVAVIGSGAVKVAAEGFIPDVSDEVLVEFQGGPLFMSRGNAFTWSAHMRWDFNKDADWSFYGLGGLAGSITGASLGSVWALYPRFGVGTLWNVTDQFTLRAEVSREWITAGLAFGL